MTADLSAVPEIVWMPEPLVRQPPPGVLPPAEVFAQLQSFSAAPTPFVDFRRANFVGTAPAPRMAAEAALLKYGCGTCGPRSFYGTLDVHLELKSAIAAFLGTEQSIIYLFGACTDIFLLPHHVGAVTTLNQFGFSCVVGKATISSVVPTKLVQLLLRVTRLQFGWRLLRVLIVLWCGSVWFE